MDWLIIVFKLMISCGSILDFLEVVGVIHFIKAVVSLVLGQVIIVWKLLRVDTIDSALFII